MFIFSLFFFFLNGTNNKVPNSCKNLYITLTRRYDFNCYIVPFHISKGWFATHVTLIYSFTLFFLKGHRMHFLCLLQEIKTAKMLGRN
jgi:hypothetical protein